MKHDCRKINGQVCPYLNPVNESQMKQSNHMYLCDQLHVVLDTDYINKSKPTEKLLGIIPNFNCEKMIELRKIGKARPMVLSINNSESVFWNED